MLGNVSEVRNNEMNSNRRKMIWCAVTNDDVKMYLSVQYMKQCTIGM